MKIPAIIDTHVHLRQGNTIWDVAKYSARYCKHVIIMPNTDPPIITCDDVAKYKNECQAALGDNCAAHMTAMLTDQTVVDGADIVGYKIYPQGATTNSHNGISEDLLLNWTPKFIDTIKAIQDNNLVLMHHGELPSVPVLDREHRYCDIVFDKFLRRFRNLKMTFEHVTTARAIEAIKAFYDYGQNIRGTITLHHLQNTLDDLLGGELRPDLFCKPVLKSEHDRLALIEAIKHPAFMLGSDSAPHPRHKKYCSHGCAGVFTAPVLIEALFEWFENNDLLQYWDYFTYMRANQFYGFTDFDKEIELIEKPWIVPNDICGITPYKSRETLKYVIQK